MNKVKSERELLADISKKLDQIVGLLIVRQSGGDENANIKLLYELDWEPAMIGAVLGLTPNAVMVRMSRMRKKAQGATQTTRK